MSVAVNSLIPVEQWLATTLKGDATLAALAPGGVFVGQTPEGMATFPAVVFGSGSALPVGAVGNAPFMVNAVYFVKVIAKSDSYVAADNAFNRILFLLDQKSGTATAGTVYSVQQEGQYIRYPETGAGGIQFRHSGGNFRIYAH